jgi:hypothetical protein
MKIGSISKGLQIHHKIIKQLSGHLVLDNDLEDIFEKKENATHYGFNLRGKSAIQSVREVVGTHLDKFQQALGLKVESSKSKARQEMLDTLKELNQLAQKLGLQTDFSSGEPPKQIEIHIKSFDLPNPGTTRVEMGEKVGPIIYEILNYSTEPQQVKLRVICQQFQKADVQLLDIDVDLKSSENKSIKCPSFKLTMPEYEDGKCLVIKAIVESRKTKVRINQVTRILWIGMEPDVKQKDPISAGIYLPEFPRPKSKRVERHEVIRNIGFHMTNNLPYELNVKFDFLVRKAKTQNEDVRIIKPLLVDKNHILPALSDAPFSCANIVISDELYGNIFDNESALPGDKKCEIYLSIKAAISDKKHGITQGQLLSSKKCVTFYCGIDPEGMSIFKNVLEKDDPTDGRRSWTEGSSTDGYDFILNVGHSSFKIYKEDDDIRKIYIRDLMLFQAYTLCLKNNIFKGPAESYKDILTDENTPAYEVVNIIDSIIGSAINEIG